MSPPRETLNRAAKTPASKGGWITAICCGLLLAAFGVTSYLAERTKCATFDEPLHSVAGFLVSHYGDYRANPEDPPLWQRWANLLEPRDALRINQEDPQFRATLRNLDSRDNWLDKVLYGTAGIDADQFLMRQRMMLILLGVMLGALIALWSWQLGGAIAAIASTAIFSLDPNFLAHTAMIKNDVAITLAGLALAYSVWRLGRRISIWWICAVLLASAVATVTKFSWPIFLLSACLLLIVRAVIPWPWSLGNAAIRSKWARIALTLGLFVAIAASSCLMIWANYSFRFGPAPDGEKWDFRILLMRTEVNDLGSTHPERKSTLEELKSWQPPAVLRLAMWCEENHLLPQTYIYGFIFTYSASRVRYHYLFHKISLLGDWYYFPLAFVFKLPISILISICLALVVGGLAIYRGGRALLQWGQVWTFLCICVPPLVFTCVVMRSNLNIGFRHFLPAMPFIYIGVGVAAARVWQRWGKSGRLALAGLAIGLVAETALAFPDYIAFFNTASGGSPGGLVLLGDSNLDWGQDLPLLARWQRQNPNIKLYLSYFGTASPAYYGIRDAPIAGDFASIPAEQVQPTMPGVLAISASNLQGIYLDRATRQKLQALVAGQQPMEILGGTIYLYRFPPPQ